MFLVDVRCFVCVFFLFKSSGRRVGSVAQVFGFVLVVVVGSLRASLHDGTVTAHKLVRHASPVVVVGLVGSYTDFLSPVKGGGFGWKKSNVRNWFLKS